jgi:hypothetical protein
MPVPPPAFGRQVAVLSDAEPENPRAPPTEPTEFGDRLHGAGAATAKTLPIGFGWLHRLIAVGQRPAGYTR